MKNILKRIDDLKREGRVECKECSGYGSIKIVRLGEDDFKQCSRCKGQGFISWIDDLKGGVDGKRN